MNRARANYWVDVAIGVSFVLSSLSGLVFLLPGDATSEVLGVGYRAWNALHTWSSLVMIAGVGGHLALHWTWMVAMTRRMLPSRGGRTAGERAQEPALAGAAGNPLSRRAFLALGGTAAVAAGVVIAGLKAFAAPNSAAASQAASQTSETSSGTGVACPFGVVDDPYPGRCRHYRDSDGDGICDYSVASSGTDVSADAGGSWSRHRSDWGRP